MPVAINHFETSESGPKLPEGPIMSPKPGPTLDMAVAAPENAVKLSSPVSDKSSARMIKKKKYRKIKLITEAETVSLIIWPL